MTSLVSLALAMAFFYGLGRYHGRRAQQLEHRKAAQKLLGLFKKDE